MAKSDINGISFSIDNEMDFISFVDLISKNNCEIVNLRKTMNEFKVKLIDNIRLNDDVFYNEILKVTNRFDDMIDKIIKL